MTFRDYGYRLMPNFAQAFQQIKPTMTAIHLMPAIHFSELPSPESDTFLSDDALVIGASQLINLAKERNNNEIFLTGRSPRGQYITLDLMKDTMPHGSVETTKVIDIDSLIWVTRYPSFRRSINIFTKPVIRNKPPIFKHNHLFVEILVPQSEDEKLALGPRKEQVTR